MGSLMMYLDAEQTGEYFNRQDEVYKASLAGEKK
jgi:hypothetical protein